VVNRTSETVSITCPNNNCGKNFVKPLSTVNIQENYRKTYQACPYCLTEVSIVESEYQQEEKAPEIETFEANEDFKQLEDGNIEMKSYSQRDEKENDSGCKYHLGYLGEDKHQQIPDDCLVCAKIIECMRQK